MELTSVGYLLFLVLESENMKICQEIYNVISDCYITKFVCLKIVGSHD